MNFLPIPYKLSIIVFIFVKNLNKCDWNGYYDMCVTAHETEEKFWNAFDEFVKTL
jgi:hypothetical protein